jgi:cytochrome c
MSKAALARILLGVVFVFLVSACQRPLQPGDPQRGKALFAEHCASCHNLYRDDEGPRLTGVYGRTSGAVAGFPYSAALRDAHIVWGDATLDRWLANPRAFVPGSEMPISIKKTQQRRDLIAYLKLSGKNR